MKLDKEQVELINSFLVKNDVVFDDIRYEIIDHIACDIEQNFENIAFHEAIKDVFLKWEPQIKHSESIWVTTWASFPKIILKKLKRLLMPFGIMFTVVFLCSQLFSEYLSETLPIIILYKKEFLMVYCSWLFLMLFLGIKMYFTKAYTTYKYVNKRILYVICITTIIVFSSKSMDGLLVFLGVNIFSSLFLVQNYKSHYKYINYNS